MAKRLHLERERDCFTYLKCGPWRKLMVATSDIEYFKRCRNKCKRCYRSLKGATRK